MLTIAGGIILAVIFMFIVLPLLGAMFGAIFEGIGSFFADLLKHPTAWDYRAFGFQSAAMFLGGAMDYATAKLRSPLLMSTTLANIPFSYCVGSLSVFLKVTTVDLVITARNIFNNEIKDKYSGTPRQKTWAYAGDICKEIYANSPNVTGALRAARARMGFGGPQSPTMK